MPMGSRAAPQGASFILGQEQFRMGLLTIGMPGDPHGIRDWMPTIADVVKSKGYATGQFGKNHLGERDEHLPTNHGFDEFFGNLYHLNAEEEPEGYFYPKDEEFRKNFGPRGSHRIERGRKDRGYRSAQHKAHGDRRREFLAAAKDFIERQTKADKPFFRRQGLQGPSRRLQPHRTEGRGQGTAPRSGLLFRPGRQSECDPVERLEAQLCNQQ
ncbi:hypothetical protein CN071_05155 [Sinorhizobium meliloti]|nr:hypothetical protein C3L21_33910 [Sinorhizobium meliloti]RVI56311.1 hypothetical protein CN195_00690 [Sinorhizobium meliloti]RVJ55599.1 hypothetical protein CN175_07830 [Sinorhizobium meliloti]RVL32498.1 hypothetical protein CN147_05010 [Sinorhizobium meliloti]RVL86936.1 hypothetical protein CN140_04155 [Sinorhizobium meliloti]